MTPKHTKAGCGIEKQANTQLKTNPDLNTLWKICELCRSDITEGSNTQADLCQKLVDGYQKSLVEVKPA